MTQNCHLVHRGIIDIIFRTSGSVNLRPSVTESDSFVTSQSFMRWEVGTNSKIEFMKDLMSQCLGTKTTRNNV